MSWQMLDLCCGMGGWSDGFSKHGFKCTGLDIKKSRKYKHQFIKADIFEWQPTGKYHVITASPLCAPFSSYNFNLQTAKNHGQVIDHRIGLDMIYRCFEIAEKLKPTFFILENVRGISSFLGEPRLKIRYGHHDRTKYAYLYGTFPDPGLIMVDGRRTTTRKDFDHNSDILGYIPSFVSEGIAQACKNSLAK